MHRRAFFKRLSLGFASLAGIFAGISFLRIFAQRSGHHGMKIKLGQASDFPVDTYTLIEEEELFVYRDHEGIKVVSAICTHLGCTVQRTSDGFECPCHGSCYSEDGKVLSGPAPRSLAWYQVSKAADGRIQVDKNREVESSVIFNYS